MILRTRLAAILHIAALSFFFWPRGVIAQEYFGLFQGELIVKTLPGGRNLELTNPFAFSDSDGKLWPVPVGTVVDGASIPQAFWSIIGGPFEDKYREASVIHDHFCDQKTDSWENVHLVFYKGMRARGVAPVKAKLMYAAVYAFGPRWIGVTPGETGKLISGQPILLDDAKKAIVQFISDNDPSIAAINEIADQLAAIETIEQLEKILYENTNCTPILSSGNSEFLPSKTLVLCGLSTASKRQAAIRNLRALVTNLRNLVSTQRYYFLPIIDEYVESQDPAKWDRVKEWSRNVYGLIKLGMRSALDVEVTGAQGTPLPIDDVLNVLSARSVMISPILSGPRKSQSEMAEWASQYRLLVQRLEKQLTNVEERLSSLTQ